MSNVGHYPGTSDVCGNGHLLIGGNVSIDRHGHRECQACVEDRRRKAAAAKREKRAAAAPVPVLPRMDFLGQGACREADPTLFETLTKKETHECHGQPALLDRIARAQAVCDSCPVKARCGEWAEAVGEQGVWGGRYMSRDTRRRKGAA